MAKRKYACLGNGAANTNFHAIERHSLQIAEYAWLTTWNYNLKKSLIDKKGWVLVLTLFIHVVLVVSSINHGKEKVRMPGNGAANTNFHAIERHSLQIAEYAWLKE